MTCPFTYLQVRSKLLNVHLHISPALTFVQFSTFKPYFGMTFV